MSSSIFVSSKSFIDRLFKFSSQDSYQYRRFLSQMVEGVLGSRSTIVANVARFLNEEKSLRYTEKRLVGI
jgi:hypothetical protein